MREKDVQDIENELVYKELNWELLDRLVDEVCYGMLNDYEVRTLQINYKNYKEKFKCEN